MSWDASQIKPPNWAHVMAAFIEGAREAKANQDASEADFRRAADGYTKRVFEEVDPESERALRLGDWRPLAALPEWSALLNRIATSERWPEEGQMWGYLLDEATHDALQGIKADWAAS